MKLPEFSYRVKLWEDSVKDWRWRVSKGLRMVGEGDTRTRGDEGYALAKACAERAIERHANPSSTRYKVRPHEVRTRNLERELLDAA